MTKSRSKPAAAPLLEAEANQMEAQVEQDQIQEAQALVPAAGTALAQPDSLLNLIERAARDDSVDMEKMERLFALYERREAAERELKAKQAFSSAMRAAQEEMTPVRKDADNPQTRSKYASYAALDRAIRAIYTKHGFGISFDQGEIEKADFVRVLAFVEHEGGHSRTHHIDMPADGKGAKGGDVMTKTHATGSAVSYGRRYLLGMIWNLAVTDDDGNAASSTEAKIDEGEVAILSNMIEKLPDPRPDDETKFLAYFGKKIKLELTALADIPASKFEDACNVIKGTAKARAG